MLYSAGRGNIPALCTVLCIVDNLQCPQTKTIIKEKNDYEKFLIEIQEKYAIMIAIKMRSKIRTIRKD